MLHDEHGPSIVDELLGQVVETSVVMGDARPEPITPQYTQGITVGIWTVTATHDGQSAFTVRAIVDNQPIVLVAATGQYRGARP